MPACPDDAALEEERERFLREFKAQVYASRRPRSTLVKVFDAAWKSNHPGDSSRPPCAKSCYLRLQERVDLLEAALHMDLKEATQMIYDAVWSDPSDPSKTYHNAAHAHSGGIAQTRRHLGGTGIRFSLWPLSYVRAIRLQGDPLPAGIQPVTRLHPPRSSAAPGAAVCHPAWPATLNRSLAPTSITRNFPSFENPNPYSPGASSDPSILSFTSVIRNP